MFETVSGLQPAAPTAAGGSAVSMRRPVTGLVLLATTALVGAAVAAPRAPDPVFVRCDSLLRAGAPDSVLAVVGPIVDAAVAARDTVRELEARLHVAGAMAMSGRLRAAEAEARRCRALADALDEPGAARMADRWLGYALLGQGRVADAQQTYAALRDAAASAGDRREEAYARMGLAYLALGRGETAQAAAGYERAVPLFNAVGEEGMALDCLVGLARVRGREGRYQEMRDLYARVLREGEAAGLPRVVGYALNNLGTYEYQAGDPGLAVDYWNRVLAPRLAVGDVSTTITPRLNLALARMELGDFDEAVSELRELRDQCEAGGYGEQEAAVLAQLAAAEQARGEGEAAAATWRRLIALPEAGQDGRLDAALNLVRHLARLGRHGSALALADSAAAHLAAGASPLARAEIDLVRADALAALDRPGDALPLAARACATVRAAGFRRTELAALLSRARCERALARATDGDPARALVDSALVHLQEARRRWADLRAAPRDPRWREQRGALGSAIHLELASLLLAGPRDVPDSARVRAAFDALQGYKARTLLERMLGPDAWPADAPAEAPPTLARLQDSILRPDEVVLDFYLGADGSLMFAASRHGCRAVPLPPAAQLGQQVRLFLELAAAPPAAGLGADVLQPAARRLAAEFYGPVAAELGSARRVVIAADGVLNRLPFELLPQDTAAGAPIALGDVVEVARVPSLTVLAKLRQEAPLAATRGLLVLDSTDRDGPDALPGAAREVAGLRSRYRDVTVERPGCGAADGNWAAALPPHVVLHVPTHTETYDQRPWNSRIALGRDGNGATCWLTSADVAASRAQAELTVLSGCSSAGGRALSGEGVLGLTGAFLAAGSRAVVASLWDVDDAATAAFMDRFYRALAGGSSTAGALAAARRDLAGSPATAAPCYWAGFVVVGDGGVTVPLQRRLRLSAARVSAAAAIVAVVVALLPLPWRRRRRVIFRRGRSLP